MTVIITAWTVCFLIDLALSARDVEYLMQLYHQNPKERTIARILVLTSMALSAPVTLLYTLFGIYLDSQIQDEDDNRDQGH